MASFDLSSLEEMKKLAEFGQAVINLAKDAGIVPKRVLTKTKVVEKIKVVTRRPRRTKAEMVAARAAGLEGVGSPAPTVTEGAVEALLK